MKLRTIVVLLVFTLSVFIAVFGLSGMDEASYQQEEKKLKWIMPKGAELLGEEKPHYFGRSKQQYFMHAMLEKYKELTNSLEYLYKEGDRFDLERMGLLLERQGTVIETDEGAVTGIEEIAKFFASQRKKTGVVEFDLPLKARVSAIQKSMEGYKVDRVVHIKFQFSFITKEGSTVIQNDTYGGDTFLFHRYICRPDG
jgi:hypothetical protein